MSIADIILIIYGLLQLLIPLLVTLGVVYFIWGVVQYVIGGGDEAKKKGRDRMIFGIIGLVMWGLVVVVINTFNLQGGFEVQQNINNLVAPAPVDDCKPIGTGSKLPDVMNYFTCVIGKSVIPLLFAVAVVMFVWGAVKFFIIDSAEEKKREQGKQFMLWGIIALAVMLSIWGLVNILGNTFGISSGGFLPGVKP